MDEGLAGLRLEPGALGEETVCPPEQCPDFPRRNSGRTSRLGRHCHQPYARMVPARPYPDL